MPISNITANTADRSMTRGGEASWAAARDATAAASVGAENAATFYAISNGTASYRVDRIGMYFDLSSIPTNATVTDVTLTGKTATDWTNTDNTPLTLVAFTPADLNEIAVEDFDQQGTTSFGTTTPAGASTAFTITLNASGITHVQTALGSNAKFAIITGRDFDNSAPTGTNQLQIYSADEVTETKPTLNVTYTPATTTTSTSTSTSSSTSSSSTTSTSSSSSSSSSTSSSTTSTSTSSSSSTSSSTSSSSTTTTAITLTSSSTTSTSTTSSTSSSTSTSTSSSTTSSTTSSSTSSSSSSSTSTSTSTSSSTSTSTSTSSTTTQSPGIDSFAEIVGDFYMGDVVDL